jgi:2-polyprenyl-6-methoxyphenol hydroxylase-like FAD-dependent oxidoreductase
MSRVLVVGGGLAGLATAIALRHAGLDAAVHEARPAGPAGFLTIMPNGLDALRAIDAEHLVLDHSFPTAEVHLHGRRPRVLSLPGARTIRRADLLRALTDEARRRGVEIAYGKRLVGVRSHGSVTAFFGDGAGIGGDLLVGADGVHSSTRSLIDPNAPEPEPVGWRLVVGIAREVPPADWFRERFGRRADCGHLTSPAGEAFWFAHVPGGEQDLQLPALPVWSRAGMVLVGDAAHAASPATVQGASLAFEDAVTLAKCLRDNLDTTAALHTYERLRRDRVEDVVRSGPVRRLRPADLDRLCRHHVDWDA